MKPEYSLQVYQADLSARVAEHEAREEEKADELRKVRERVAASNAAYMAELRLLGLRDAR